jgi:hypothetical protein
MALFVSELAARNKDVLEYVRIPIHALARPRAPLKGPGGSMS